MEIRSLDLKSLFFVMLLVFLGLVMIHLISPFLNLIVIALVIVQLFHPVYRGLRKYLRNPALAGILSSLATITLVIIPFILIIIMATGEVTSLISKFGGNNLGQSQLEVSPPVELVEIAIGNFIGGVNDRIALAGISFAIPEPDFGKAGFQVLEDLQDRLIPFVSGIISFSAQVLFMGFIFFITLSYMFIEYENLPKLVSRISPLDDELDELLYHKFTETNRAVIKGSFLVAIAQASAVSAALILMGVGAPVLLWLIMVLLSLVPIGSGLVWAPIGLAMILGGNPVGGIILIVYSAIIINVIETTLRPQLMKNAMQLHPLIIIFSALGGISMFGPLGLLYGPVIAVFFTSMMDVYANRYYGQKSHQKNPNGN